MKWLVGLVLACVFATSAAAQQVVYEDRGGMIGNYIARYQQLQASGAELVIDGSCYSACTLALGLLPEGQLCATERARFGFHGAWTRDEEGQPVPSPEGTQILMELYPDKIRDWVKRNGGLKKKMIFLQGKELFKYVRSCPTARITVHAAAH